MTQVITPEQRTNIIAAIKNEGFTIQQMSEKSGITEKTIRVWIRKKADTSNTLTRELQKVRRENLFLKDIVLDMLMKQEDVKKNIRHGQTH